MSDSLTGPYISIDWSRFSGGKDRSFPAPEEWNANVVAPLVRTKDWLMAAGRPRRLNLEGQRRLSASVALGGVFEAVSGFTLSMDIRGSVWRTDAHATATTPRYQWDEELINKDAGPAALAVSIGILRDPSAEVVRFLEGQGLN